MLQVPVNDRYLFVGGPLHANIRILPTPLGRYHYVSPFKHVTPDAPLPQRIQVTYSRIHLEHQDNKVEEFDIYSCLEEEPLTEWLMSPGGKFLLTHYLDYLGVEL